MCKAFLTKNIGASSSKMQNTTFPPRQKAKAEAGRFDFRFLAREGVDELLKHKALVLFVFFVLFFAYLPQYRAQFLAQGQGQTNFHTFIHEYVRLSLLSPKTQ